MEDVIIIGGGIIGLLSARELLRRGRSVMVLDAGHDCPPASWAAGGILSALFPWRYPASITALERRARSAYRDLATELVAAGESDPEVEDTGMLVLDVDERDAALQWAAREGIALEYLTDVSAVEPSFGGCDGLWLPDVATVRNSRLLHGLGRMLRAEKRCSLQQAKVTVLEPSAGAWRVHAQGAAVDGRQVVVAAGTWSRELLAPLGVELPMMPVQGEMLFWPPGPPAPAALLLSKQGYVVPRRDGSMLAGSTLRENVSDQMPTREAGRALQRMACELWPPLAGAMPQAQWAGVRPGNRRESPFIGEVARHPGLFLATGHYRSGLACAPGTAGLLGALLCGEEPPVDPRPYELDAS